MRTVSGVPPRVVLAVTSERSLTLMDGLPEYLATRGWDVHVVADGSPDPSVPAPVTFHSLAMSRDPSPRRDLLALARWVRLLRELRPDVVVAGTPKAGLLGMVAARLCRVPTRIYHLRGLRLETERGLRVHVLAALEQLTSRMSTVVLSVSGSLRTEYLARRLCTPEKVVVLGSGSSNGVDLARFDRFDGDSHVAEVADQLGLDTGRPVVGFVGRLTADKGVGALVKAVSALRVSGIPVQLLILGRSDSAFDSVVLDAESEDRFIFTAGHVAEPGPYYRLMDVLCLPSRREGFPNVVLEAAASRVPTVASDATGCVDAVVDGETGLLFPVDDEKMLARQLSVLLTDDRLRRRIGRAARQRAEIEFDRREVWRRIGDFVGQQMTAGSKGVPYE